MILLADKPSGMTSQKVVSAIKHASPLKLKIGHTGTLDPMCTGLLPVLTGRDTRLTQFFPHRKSYLAAVRFGVRTDTGDVTGAVLETSGCPEEASFLAVLPSFLGRQMQVPPMYSAVHVNGKRLYELARAGIEVDRQPREIEIEEIFYAGKQDADTYLFSVTCSAGTYIRTLCEQIGERLGVCATMASLRRTASNGFRLEQAHSLETLTEAARNGTLSDFSVPLSEAFPGLSTATVPDDGLKYYCNGGILTVNRLLPPAGSGELRFAQSESGVFLGLMKVSEDGQCQAVYYSEECEQLIFEERGDPDVGSDGR